MVPTEADGRYSFRDLVALRIVVSLLDAGLPMVRVRSALEVLRASGDELAGLRIVTDGVSVFACYDDGQILDALRTGQLALFVPQQRGIVAPGGDRRPDEDRIDEQRGGDLLQPQPGMADGAGDDVAGDRQREAEAQHAAQDHQHQFEPVERSPFQVMLALQHQFVGDGHQRSPTG